MNPDYIFLFFIALHRKVFFLFLSWILLSFLCVFGYGLWKSRASTLYFLWTFSLISFFLRHYSLSCSYTVQWFWVIFIRSWVAAIHVSQLSHACMEEGRHDCEFFFYKTSNQRFAFCLCSYEAISNLKLVTRTRFFDLSTGT